MLTTLGFLLSMALVAASAADTQYTSKWGMEDALVSLLHIQATGKMYHLHKMAIVKRLPKYSECWYIEVGTTMEEGSQEEGDSRPSSSYSLGTEDRTFAMASEEERGRSQVWRLKIL